MSEPIRLILVAPYFPPLPSGAARQAEAMLSVLGDRVEVTVCTLGRSDLESETRTARGWRVLRRGRADEPGHLRPFAWHTLRMLAALPRPDVLFLLGAGPSTYAALAFAQVRAVPAVVKLTMEGEDDLVTLSRKRTGTARLALLRTARALVCPSRRLAALAADAGAPPGQVHWIPNGVDLDRFRPLPAEGRQPWLVVLGGIQPRKRPDLALAASLPLLAKRPDLSLHFVGGEGRRDSDLAYAADVRGSVPADLVSRVVFHGGVDRPEEILGRSTILIHASEAEGLPNAVLEAMAAGAVPVARDLPATREAIDGESGVLVASPDPEAWGVALDRLLDDPERLEAMRASCRRRVEEAFDLHATAEKYAALFRAVSRSGA